MDEAVDNFMAITGATGPIARHYLGMTDGNVEQGIQLFFDSPDLAAALPQEATTAPPERQTNIGRTDAEGVVHLDSENEGDLDMGTDSPPAGHSSSTAPARNTGLYEDDEAMARRMQEELYSGGGEGAQNRGGGGDDDVRAPIARTTETLVGPGSDYPMDNFQSTILQQMRARQISRAGRPGVFNQQPTSSTIWDETNSITRREGLSEATGGASETSSKAAKLAELFRPPFELICRLPWDEARDEGKEKEKWILVNVQDPSIFDCQSLNRDIWKNEGIRETVKENFIFMQYSKDDPSASQYVQYYFPSRDSDGAYPHIAIVDPRTGEQVKVWSGPPVPKAGDFLMQLYEFLDRYSLQVTAKNPVARRKPEKSASVDVGRLTEEEMLDLAMHNSLAANGAGNETGPREYDPDDLTKSIGDVSKGKGKGKEVVDDDDNNDDDDGEVIDIEKEAAAAQDDDDNNGDEAPQDSAFARISSDKPHTEPANEPASTTRIQFRHSNGRIIRRFALADRVQRLYEWLKAAPPLEGKEGLVFELKSMGKDLVGSLDATVEEAGLKNGTVMVEYIED